MVGVWHVVYRGAPDAFSVTEEELQSFLDETNEAYPSMSLSLDDVSMVNAGLILFADNNKEDDGIRFGKRSILWDHERMHGVEGLVTLIGVRATTARGLAEKAVTLVSRKMGKRIPKSCTETTPIHGGRIGSMEEFLELAIRQRTPGQDEDVVRSLVLNHGSEYGQVMKITRENPGWAGRVGDTHVIKAEVVHAVREEMARKLGDVVFRRTDLATAEHPGEEALRACADLMAAELGWGEGRIQQELEDVLGVFPRSQGKGKPDEGVGMRHSVTRATRR